MQSARTLQLLEIVNKIILLLMREYDILYTKTSNESI